MKTILLISLCLFGVHKFLYAQLTIHPSPGNVTWCPEQLETYEVASGNSQQTNCKYKWTITNGTIEGDDNNKKLM